MLFGTRNATKFEAGCIGMHLSQARSNLASLDQERFTRRYPIGLDNTDPVHNLHAAWRPVNVATDVNEMGTEAATAKPPLFQDGAATAKPPLFQDGGSPMTCPQGEGFTLGQDIGVKTMIANIAQGLHEELSGFLAAFSTRLAAREAALAATCDRASTAENLGLNTLSRRVDERLADCARQNAEEREAALQVMRESISHLNQQIAAQHARVESLVSGEDWGRQLKEATRNFDQRLCAKIDALERRMQELQTTEGARQRTWRDAIVERCDVVERRVTKHFKNSKSLADQASKLMPDVERMRELCDKLEAERSAFDTWQRRLAACENAGQRVVTLETRLGASQKETERLLDEHSQSLRECMHQNGVLGARVTTLESYMQGFEGHSKAFEQRMLTTWDQQQRRNHGQVDSLRETFNQRFAHVENLYLQRLDRVRLDFEHRTDSFMQRVTGEMRSFVSSCKLAVPEGSPSRWKAFSFVNGLRSEPPRSPNQICDGRINTDVDDRDTGMDRHAEVNKDDASAPRASGLLASQPSQARPSEKLIVHQGTPSRSSNPREWQRVGSTVPTSPSSAAVFEHQLNGGYESSPGLFVQATDFKQGITRHNARQGMNSGESSLPVVSPRSKSNVSKQLETQDGASVLGERTISRSHASDKEGCAVIPSDGNDAKVAPAMGSAVLASSHGSQHSGSANSAQQDEQCRDTPTMPGHIQNASKLRSSPYHLGAALDVRHADLGLSSSSQSSAQHAAVPDATEPDTARTADVPIAVQADAVLSGQAIGGIGDFSHLAFDSLDLEASRVFSDADGAVGASVDAVGQVVWQSEELKPSSVVMTKQHVARDDDDEDSDEGDVEAMLQKSMQRSPWSGLETAARREESFQAEGQDDDVEARLKNIEAMIQQGMQRSHGERLVNETHREEAFQNNEEDEEDSIEAMIQRSVRNTQPQGLVTTPRNVDASIEQNKPSRQSLALASREDAIRVTGDDGNDVEAMMQESMQRCPSQRLFTTARTETSFQHTEDHEMGAMMQTRTQGYPSHGFVNTTRSEESLRAGEDEDEDDDVEAMMRKSMQRNSLQGPATAAPREGGLRDNRIEGESDADETMEQRMQRGAPHRLGISSRREELVARDDHDEDDVEAMMQQSMQRSGSHSLGVSTRREKPTRVDDDASEDDVEAMMQQSMQKGGSHRVGVSSRREEPARGDDDDEDEVEAVMQQSMQSGAQNRLGISTRREEAGQGHDDDDEDDVEAMMQQSMQRGGSHRLGISTRREEPARGDDDDEDDVEAMMQQSMQTAAQNSLGISSLREEPGRVDDDDEDDVEAMMQQSMQRSGSHRLGTSTRREEPNRVDDGSGEDDVEAMMQQSMQKGAQDRLGISSRREEPAQVDDDEDDVEAMMQQSMQRGAQNRVGVSSRREEPARVDGGSGEDDVEAMMQQSMQRGPSHRLGVSSRRGEPARVDEDDSEDDVEEMMQQSLQKGAQNRLGISTRRELPARDDDDDEDDVEAMMQQSMQKGGSHRVGVSTRREQPGRVDDDDSDDDVEAMMQNSMHRGAQNRQEIPSCREEPARVDDDDEDDVEAMMQQSMQRSGSHRLGTSTRREEPNRVDDGSGEDDVEAMMQQSMQKGAQDRLGISSRREEPAQVNDDDEDDVEAMMQQSMQRSGSHRLGTSTRGEEPNRVDDGSGEDDVEAMMQQSMQHGAQNRLGISSRREEAARIDDDDEDDVEAMMQQSMQRGAQNRLGISTHREEPARVDDGTGEDEARMQQSMQRSGSHRLGVSTRRQQPARVDDDSEDDVEAMMQKSMQKGGSHRLGVSTYRKEPTRADDGDGEDDVEAMMQQSMQRSGSHRLGVSTRREKPMRLDDDDDEDDVEAMMQQSMQTDPSHKMGAVSRRDEALRGVEAHEDEDVEAAMEQSLRSQSRQSVASSGRSHGSGSGAPQSSTGASQRKRNEQMNTLFGLDASMFDDEEQDSEVDVADMVDDLLAY